MLIPSEDDWLTAGRFGGSHVRNAEERILAVISDLPIALDVLNTVHADGGLAERLEAGGLLQDARLDRVGRDWSEERSAIATNTAETFETSWPAMRRRLQEASLVLLTAATDAYVIALFAEFSSSVAALDEPERIWTAIDRELRKLVRSERSTSGAWVAMSKQASLPERVKLDLLSWKEEHGAAVDEMTLARNCLVHRAGVVDKRLAALTRLSPAGRIVISESQLGRYRRACLGLTCAVDPSI